MQISFMYRYWQVETFCLQKFYVRTKTVWEYTLEGENFIGGNFRNPAKISSLFLDGIISF